MLESLAEWTTAPVLAAAYTETVPVRAGHRHALIAPYGLFDLSDGRRVLIAVQSDPEWRSMAQHLLGDAELGTDPRFTTNADRIANVDDLEAVISAHLAAIPAAEAVAGLEAGRIAHAWARDQLDVWNHEQLRARGRFMTVSTPTGEAEVYKPPFNISGLPLPEPTVPALGEHDPELVAELIARGGGAGAPEG